MKKMVVFLLAGLCCLATGYVAGWQSAGASSENLLERTVAMSWGDGKYGEAFYGAHVYLVPLGDGYSVRARVLIGRNNGMIHDCGELGRAATDAESVKNWGSIVWRDDGLHIGAYFLPRSKMNAHR